MRVGVVGTGHVGLVSAAALASIGHEVVAIDADADKVARLAAEAKAPFYEPGLDEMIALTVETGTLRFTTDPADALAGARIVMICVGRPPSAAGDTSLSAVEQVGREVARHAAHGVIVVEKSTVPPGTAERLRVTIVRERPGLDFSVASNPEFLREGHAVRDTLEPDRIVVGAGEPRAHEALRELYSPILEATGAPLIETDVPSAELAKLASNAFLAVKISFANALARVADAAGADVTKVTEVMGADPRIGPAFLAAGLGYGGYCLPKDVQTLQGYAERNGYDFTLLRDAARVNDDAARSVAEKVEEAVWNIEGKRVALLGLAFKAGTDDVRAAPALALARRLLADGAVVVGWDPMAGDAAADVLPDLDLTPDPYAAAEGAHCVVLCTEWDQLRTLDPAKLGAAMAYPVVIDGRNLLDPDVMRAEGFSYASVGRPKVAGPGE